MDNKLDIIASKVNTGHEVLCDGDKYFALEGWNGEKYYDCYKCDKLGIWDGSKEVYIIRPVYELVADDQYEFVDAEIEVK